MSDLGYSPTHVAAGDKEIAYKTGEFDQRENDTVKRASDHYSAQMVLRGLRGPMSLSQEKEKWHQIIPVIQKKLYTWTTEKQIMKAAIDLGVKSTSSLGIGDGALTGLTCSFDNQSRTKIEAGEEAGDQVKEGKRTTI